MSKNILLKNVRNQEDLIKQFKKIGIKKSDLKKVYFANNMALVVLKKRVRVKIPKSLIANEEIKEEIIIVNDFIQEYKELIEWERIAEIEHQLNEIRGFSAKERELFGRAILNLKGKREPSCFNLYFVRFSRNKEIQTEISSGDVVLISRGEPLKSDLTGTVSEVKKHYITVAFENQPPKWVYSNFIRIDLYINDITFKRMSENLENIRHASKRVRELRNIVLNLRSPQKAEAKSFEIFNQKLNFSQKEAISSALGARDLFLIHGPPGTGKTSTLIELILQEVKRGEKVLATADSNTAVDNMLQRLSKYDLNLVRIGHPARIVKELQEFSIHSIYEKSVEAKAIKSGWEEVALLVKKRDEFSKPSPSRTRGMSRERILKLAKEGKSQRGVGVQTIQSMAKWISADREIEDKVKKLKMDEEAVYKKIISLADVVLSTNSMVMSDILKDFVFDVAVIDEGSQQVIPSTLIAISHAKRFVMAGDHKQLPPTVVSEQAKKLKYSLFEELINRYKELSKILKIQYRMNEKIMRFSNEKFYENLLIADESVKNHTLKDLNLKKPKRFENILDFEKPVVFVSTCGIEAKENLPWRSTSYENIKEAQIVFDLVKEFLEIGLKKEDIGIISPYLSQVKRIKLLFSQNEMEDIEVKSVDGFQGREKEVILISFVRSNPLGEIGFLKDLRRLNVALTRAKRKLICIGDAKTLQKDNLYKDFLDYIKQEKAFFVI